MAEPILELRSIYAERGGAEILRESSFVLPEGEAAFFMGAAGSGKSTIIKVAAGLIVPSAGEVLFRGKELRRMSASENMAFRRATGFVFQDAALWANQSLYDNLALPVRVHEPRASKAEVDRAVLRAAEIVGYRSELKARPAELSSGERRLVGLARALVLDPELLFMDEPAANLDEAAAERVVEIVGLLKDRKRSLAVVTALSDFASRFADRIGVLRDGELLDYGPYAEILARSDPDIRAVTGRLKPRPAEARRRDGSLAEAWASALAEDLDLEAGGRPEEGDEAILGDIINALPGEGEVGYRKDGS